MSYARRLLPPPELRLCAADHLARLPAPLSLGGLLRGFSGSRSSPLFADVAPRFRGGPLCFEKFKRSEVGRGHICDPSEFSSRSQTYMFHHPTFEVHLRKWTPQR